jgi:acyl-CoA thioester hydrolase
MTHDTGVQPSAESIELSSYDIPHPSPFLCRVHVDERHLSQVIEHVSNIEYVRWLDRAAELHADSLGYTRQAMLDAGIMWFVARHEIDYLGEAWRGDKLLIATWVRELHRVKSWRDYVIIRPSDESVLCRASTLWVLVDLETRKPRRISAAMTEAFTSLAGLQARAVE